ncbi:MAG: TetR/AcrR family transcriptional regulator, partial [Pseudonocardiaceae bacterium]
MRTVDPVKHRAKRQHIVNAAAELFATQGFDGTTTSEPVGKWSRGLLILSVGCRRYGAGLAPAGMRWRAGPVAVQLPGHDRDG